MPMIDDAPGYLPAIELARRIRARELSPLELMKSVIARIEQRDPSLNAFVYRGFDEALQRARAAERALVSGADLGPLHGVPTAIKDLFDFKPGWPSTFGGIPALKDNLVDCACLWCERIERAGAIVIGKTNSSVMGARGTCDNPLFGATRNPFDTTRNSGGSSGGAAAAVADGLLPFAEATDGGGSARIPAAWCGVFGFKPSFGRVPMVLRPNAFIAGGPFAAEGVVTRTVADAALVLDVLSGPDARDPLSSPAGFEHPRFKVDSALPLAGARVAYSPDLDVFPVEPAVACAVQQAVGVFEDLGARVEPRAIGIALDQRCLSDLWFRINMPLDVPMFADLRDRGLDFLGELRGQLPPRYARWLEQGTRMTVRDLDRDQRLRTGVHDAISALFADFDLLVTPTVACMPVANGARGETAGPREVAGIAVDQDIGWCLTYPFNFTGHPAASVPIGLLDGLPVGMQLVGRRHRDADVLAAAAAFEHARPWQQHYRICAERPLR